MSYTPNYPTVSIVGRQGPGAGPIPKHFPKDNRTYYGPVYIITAVFAAVFIIGPMLVRTGPHIAITRSCIMITAFMLWLFWVTVYIAQMNPLMGPRLTNATAAWLGHVWGHDAKRLDSVEL